MPELLHTQLTRALRTLPGDAMWAIAWPGEAIYVLAGRTLHLVTLDPAAEMAIVTARQIDEITSVSCEETPPRSDDEEWRSNVWERHVWTLRYAGE